MIPTARFALIIFAMGGGNSSELTSEEKALIAGKVQEAYVELQQSPESKTNQEVVFESLKR